jgi:hypothetical protein
MVPIWEPRFLYSSHSGVACHTFSRMRSIVLAPTLGGPGATPAPVTPASDRDLAIGSPAS